MKNKLSIYLAGFGAGALFMLMVVTFSLWWGLIYLAVGTYLGYVMSGRQKGHNLAITGLLSFGLVWGAIVLFAMVFCWFKPYRTMGFVQIMPYMIDLAAHHYDGNYRYDHGWNKTKS